MRTRCLLVRIIQRRLASAVTLCFRSRTVTLLQNPLFMFTALSAAPGYGDACCPVQNCRQPQNVGSLLPTPDWLLAICICDRSIRLSSFILLINCTATLIDTPAGRRFAGTADFTTRQRLVDLRAASGTSTSLCLQCDRSSAICRRSKVYFDVKLFTNLYSGELDG